ncbi:MAG TPA: sugar ABC transporter permease [Candidatus Eisenbacteria bacterium]
MRERAVLAAFLMPAAAGMLLLTLLPALVALAFSFSAWDGLSPPEWRGVATFREVLADPYFRMAARNSLVFVLMAVPLRLLGALGLALLYRRSHPGADACRTAAFLPTIVPDAAYALTWLMLLNPLHGPLNIALRAVGLPAPAWLAHGDTALLSIVIMSCFQVGEGMVVLLAGLATIPADWYRAAQLDGAGRWASFRWITLPMILPWLVLLTLRDVIMSAQNTFVPAYLMTGGGPYYATLFVPLHMYQQAFDGFRFGHAAAEMVLLLGAVALLLAIVARVARRPAIDDDAA